MYLDDEIAIYLVKFSNQSIIGVTFDHKQMKQNYCNNKIDDLINLNNSKTIKSSFLLTKIDKAVYIKFLF